MHVDQAERGFSYRQAGPLDMRMDPDQVTTAASLVNELDGRSSRRSCVATPTSGSPIASPARSSRPGR
jgi:hypothetical protein